MSIVTPYWSKIKYKTATLSWRNRLPQQKCSWAKLKTYPSFGSIFKQPPCPYIQLGADCQFFGEKSPKECTNWEKPFSSAQRPCLLLILLLQVSNGGLQYWFLHTSTDSQTPSIGAIATQHYLSMTIYLILHSGPSTTNHSGYWSHWPQSLIQYYRNIWHVSWKDSVLE